MTEFKKNVTIIIVNYHGHVDTVECIESIIQSSYNNWTVVIVDNSNDSSSIEYIEQWAKGELVGEILEDSPIHIRSSTKPIDYQIVKEDDISATSSIKQVTIIKANQNNGFAAANNVGISYALSKIMFDWVWILNNDTVIDSKALENFNFYLNSKPNQYLSMIGNEVYYYHKPNQLQGIGGMYNKWTATSRHLNTFTTNGLEEMNTRFHSNVNYIMGSSMFVSKTFIEKVGLMEERFFLYFEEIDWATRGRQNNFVLDFCPGVKVYHKEGASIGSADTSIRKSNLSDYYGNRNKVTFTRKFYPYLLPFIYSSLIISIFLRLYRMQPSRALMILKIIFKPL